MHPNAAFRWDDRDELRALIEEIGFGLLFAQTPDGPRVAQVPAVWLSDNQIGFHIARGNGIARHLDGANALFVVNGPDAYISPDWYGTNDQVPTWNYLSVELEGIVHKMDRNTLIDQIERLTASNEARLFPKSPWTRDKMAPGLFDKMLGGINGYTLDVAGWRGTKKLGQHKGVEAVENVATALAANGQSAMAHIMREMGLPAAKKN